MTDCFRAAAAPPAPPRGASWATALTHTARLLGSYGSDPGVIASLGGSAQDLPGDHTLVSFEPAGRVEEYDAAGHMVRTRSLYRPGVGSPR